MHGTLKTIEGPPNLGINLPLSSSPNTNNNGLDRVDKNAPSTPLKKAQITPTSAPQKPPAPGWTCGDCDRLFIQREVFVAHVRQEHGKVQYSPSLNPKSTPSQYPVVPVYS